MQIKNFFSSLSIILLINILLGCESSENKISKDAISNNDQNIYSNFIYSEESVIGLFLPLSGEYKDIGRSMLNAAHLALADSNNRNLSFAIIDTGAKDYNPRNAITKLSQLNTKLILGPLLYKDVEALVPYSRAINVDIICFSNNSDLTKQKVLVHNITPEIQLNELINYTVGKENIIEYFALLPNNNYGKLVSDKLKENLNLFGIDNHQVRFYSNIVELKESFIQLSNNINSQSKRSKAILFVDDKENLAIFSNLIKESSIMDEQVKIIGFENFENKINNFQLNEVIYSSKNASSDYNKFETKYNDIYGKKSSLSSKFVYDAVMAISSMLLNGQHLGYYNIINYSRSINLAFYYNHNGISHYKIPIMKFVNGKIELQNNH